MKPLVIFDVETTGIDKISGKDWIVQFSAIKVDRSTNKMVGMINEYIRPDGNYVMGIGAFIKHGIHPAALKDKPTFKELAQTIYNFMDGCDLLTYNGTQFDIPFLRMEFSRAGIEWNPTSVTCYDSFQVERERNGLRLEQVFKKYCNKTMEEAGLYAHDGLSDVKALYGVFRHQLEEGEIKPQEMLTDDNFIGYVEYNGEREYAMTFGKYKDVPLEIIKHVDLPYLKWVLSINPCKKTQDIINEIINKETL